MNLTINDWERPEVLLAAATFLQTLAAIPREEGNVAGRTEPLAGANALVANPDFTADVYFNRMADDKAGAAEMAEKQAHAGAPVAGPLGPRLTPPDELPPARVDMKGVAFNPDYCSEAKDPFYGSGPNQGQWKCRRGVPGATYDHWYANELVALSLSQTSVATPADTIDVSAAFGPATTEAPAVVNTATPRDCGQLMVWVSEQQVAGNITPEQVQAAYAKYGLTIADLFPPNDADTIGKRVALIYGELA